MLTIDEEMKNLANFAIKTAYERYKFTLDYSEKSIVQFEAVLEKIYGGYARLSEDTGEGSLLYNAATIWGSYLGEFMLTRWGGHWATQGSKRLVSIKSIEFSPIDFVYQKIVGNTRDTVDTYLSDIYKKLYRATGGSMQSMFVPVSTHSPGARINQRNKRRFSLTNMSLYAIIATFSTIIIILIALTFGFIRLLNSGIKSSEMFEVIIPTGTATSTNTSTPVPSFTITMLPTYTPQPTNTPHPTKTATPSTTPTFTPTPTSTDTSTPTKTPYIPPDTKTPTRTQVIPTTKPTQPPPPSDTPVPPVIIESCSVNPSTIDPGYTVILKFSARFSSPGYGFSTTLNPSWPGANGCAAIDTKGDGSASCDGTSGMLPSSSTVTVTFNSPVGNCTATYHTP